jgi:hypothetical protein
MDIPKTAGIQTEQLTLVNVQPEIERGFSNCLAARFNGLPASVGKWLRTEPFALLFSEN